MKRYGQRLCTESGMQIMEEATDGAWVSYAEASKRIAELKRALEEAEGYAQDCRAEEVEARKKLEDALDIAYELEARHQKLREVIEEHVKVSTQPIRGGRHKYCTDCGNDPMECVSDTCVTGKLRQALAEDKEQDQ